MNQRGKVYVGRKFRRGTGEKNPFRQDAVNIDVTSGSHKKINGISVFSDFSPLYLGPVMDNDGNYCEIFEHYWQYSKVYPLLGHTDDQGNLTPKWEDWRDKGFADAGNDKGKGHRRPPAVAKLANRRPIYGVYNGEALTLIDARKKAYVPVYAKLVQTTTSFKNLKKLVDNGSDVMIIDVDGPPPALFPNGMEVTLANLQARIIDPTEPYGHGFVIGTLLAGLNFYTT